MHFTFDVSSSPGMQCNAMRLGWGRSSNVYCGNGRRHTIFPKISMRKGVCLRKKWGGMFAFGLLVKWGALVNAIQIVSSILKVMFSRFFFVHFYRICSSFICFSFPFSFFSSFGRLYLVGWLQRFIGLVITFRLLSFFLFDTPIVIFIFLFFSLSFFF